MEQARANIILDNLIAEHKARPMIVVMALGARSGPSEALEPVPSQMEGFKPPAGRQTNYDPGNLFEKDLLTGIIPFIDGRFRTIADADHRGLSGLSQGGIQTVTIGLRHSDVFHWLVPMSAGAENQGDDQFIAVSRDVYEHPEALKKNLKLLYFVVGEEDVLQEADKRLADRLRAGGVKLTFRAVPGMHEYKVWRQGLHDVAPLLFQPAG
jgi:enterochelin esterase family protein